MCNSVCSRPPVISPTSIRRRTSGQQHNARLVLLQVMLARANGSVGSGSGSSNSTVTPLTWAMPTATPTVLSAPASPPPNRKEGCDTRMTPTTHSGSARGTPLPAGSPSTRGEAAATMMGLSRPSTKASVTGSSCTVK